jgi:DNA adenine methylase
MQKRSGPRPVVKWAGGKGVLVERLVRQVPVGPFETYAEPFAGGAALFFELARETPRRFKRAVLADLNEELITLYRVLQGDHRPLIEALGHWEQRHLLLSAEERSEHFYRVREYRPGDLSPVERSARMIFLNKTCFNGLYRVNASGLFNVPYGRYAKPRILDERTLERAHAALQGVDLVLGDFREVTAELKKGDFAYFDPPYVPLSKTSSFTAYAKQPFGAKEQAALADEIRALGKRGVRAMASNASSPETERLYEGLHLRRVPAPRAINSKGDGRGHVEELIVTTYASPPS